MRSTRSRRRSGRPPALDARDAGDDIGVEACLSEARAWASHANVLRDAAELCETRPDPGAGMGRSPICSLARMVRRGTLAPVPRGGRRVGAGQARPESAARDGLLRRRPLWRRDVRVRIVRRAVHADAASAGRSAWRRRTIRNQGPTRWSTHPSHRRCGRAGGGGLKNRFFAAFDDAAASTRARVGE